MSKLSLISTALAFSCLSLSCAPTQVLPPTPVPQAVTEKAPSPQTSSTPTAQPLSPNGPLKDGQIEFSVVDVGQGDGLVLRTSGGVTVVIDTGTDSGGASMTRFLKRTGISTVELLVLTHPHADHIGGVPRLLRSFTVKSAWISGFSANTRTQQRVLTELEKYGVATTQVRRGTRGILDGNIEINVLGPEDPMISTSRSDANANSIVLWLKHGEIDFLLTGDAEKETEERVLRVLRGRPPPQFEVLKVAHHGSRHATSQAFLERVAPNIALISCGTNNRYKHPHPDTLLRLTNNGTRSFRTDLHGTIRVRSNGKRILIVTDRKAGESTNSSSGKKIGLNVNSSTSSKLIPNYVKARKEDVEVPTSLHVNRLSASPTGSIPQSQ